MRHWRYLPGFFYFAALSHRAAKKTPGNRLAQVHNEPGMVYWTITLWDSMETMRSFRNAGAHVKAMSKLAHWCDEGAYGHWTQESPTPPTLSEARERLQLEGQFSKVLFPSVAHTNRRLE